MGDAAPVEAEGQLARALGAVEDELGPAEPRSVDLLYWGYADEAAVQRALVCAKCMTHPLIQQFHRPRREGNFLAELAMPDTSGRDSYDGVVAMMLEMIRRQLRDHADPVQFAHRLHMVHKNGHYLPALRRMLRSLPHEEDPGYQAALRRSLRALPPLLTPAKAYEYMRRGRRVSTREAAARTFETTRRLSELLADRAFMQHSDSPEQIPNRVAIELYLKCTARMAKQSAEAEAAEDRLGAEATHEETTFQAAQRLRTARDPSNIAWMSDRVKRHRDHARGADG